MNNSSNIALLQDFAAKLKNLESRSGSGFIEAEARRKLQEILDQMASHLQLFNFLANSYGYMNNEAEWFLDILKYYAGNRNEKFTILRIDGLVAHLIGSKNQYSRYIISFSEQLEKWAERLKSEPSAGAGVEWKNQTDDPPKNLIQNKGDFWEFTYNGEPTPPLKNILGMQYIAYLLLHPNKDISAITLEKEAKHKMQIGEKTDNIGEELIEVGVERGLDLLAEYDPKQIKAAIEKLEADYEVEPDPQKKIEIQEKIDQIKEYVRKSKNRFGKSRLIASPLENARKRVSAAINNAINHIEPHHKQLFQHLTNSIIFGAELSYRPEINVDWES